MAPGKRVAFIVGNSSYRHARELNSPRHDAAAMYTALKDAGFDTGDRPVSERVDLDYERTESLFKEFLERLLPGDTALIYFSGHGVQVNRDSYLVPVDAKVTPTSGAAGLIRAADLIRRTHERVTAADGATGTCLVLLDACRTDPYARSPLSGDPGGKGMTIAANEDAPLAQGRGLAEIEISGGGETFIAYATAPGTLAYGDSEAARLSMFTDEFVEHVGVRGLKIDEMMQWVREGVQTATNRKQRPWSHDNLIREFCFRPQDRKPILELAALGALAGVFVSMLSFDEVAHLVPLRGDEAHPSQLWRLAVAGILFGAVMGYGVLKWGRGTWWAAGIATFGTALAFLCGMWLIEPAAQAYQGLSKLPASIGPMFSNPEFAKVLNSIMAATFVFTAGIVFACAASTPAMRRLELFAMAAIAGFAVTLIYIVVHSVQVLWQLQPGDIKPAHMLAVHAASALWHALLGGGIGYGYTTYLPKRPPAKINSPQKHG